MSTQQVPWEAWKATVFRCPSRDAPPAEWPHYAILTPDNPMGAPVDFRANLRARNWMERELCHEKLPFFRVRGCAPDNHYWEESYAVAADESNIHELAILFGQAGYFWVQHGLVELVDIFDPRRRESLGPITDRWERA